MHQRQKNLQLWVAKQLNASQVDLQPMAGDASFRRYFRVHIANHSWVVMDAPPEKENCLSFVAIATGLRKMGLMTPEIFAADVHAGFLLLTDFGDRLYLHELNVTNAESMYQRAIDALTILQTCKKIEGWTIPLFTAEFMRQELEGFKEWFLQKHLNLMLAPQTEKDLNNCFDFLTETASNQHQVFMHRDYHSANLMSLPQNQIGILDFQDAFIGPVTYDLVSLLRDCYIDWPDKLVTQLVMQYWQQLQLKNTVSAADFLRWFDLMGLQRHLKALLTFARKFRRDQNAQYLQHIPRTLTYIADVSARYPECHALNQFVINQVMPCVQ